MKTNHPHHAPAVTSSLLLGMAFLGSSVMAQDSYSFIDGQTTKQPASAIFRIAPSSILNEQAPMLSIARSVEQKDFEGAVVDEALSFNLGMQIEPITGLNVTADAWSLQIYEAPAVGTANNWQGGLSNLYLDDSTINEFNIDNPLLGSNVDTNGFDLGASYVWDTNRFGQFTLSSTTTYVQEFENKGALLDFATPELSDMDEMLVSPELQSSLMLSWQFGNHTASAITNYFDSFKDISELNMDEINELVDDITTYDLEYGYSVKTGSKDRAIISFGIRNIFDEKTAQILNSTTRILDQNGRVAYGSIKYQF
ncbi:MAG: hypothetical protein HOK53_13890 [Gammaproteobacteria bacterium]|jgi:hypothetical protein|nr:hypothetical protein [Pseudomonadales bacterium]MBT6482970.1 hypothetical protein [Gammaproteobacteria bacterium]MDC0414703.1 hypothetical protein [Gammaproteobacteria bacterium]